MNLDGKGLIMEQITGNTVSIETLLQTHTDYNYIDIVRTEYLYHGVGIKHVVRDLQILEQFPWEDEEPFDIRIGAAAYVPIASKHLNFLAAKLFDQDLSIMEGMDADTKTTYGDKLEPVALDFYNTFFMSCDKNRKTSISQFMFDRFVSALNHTVSWTILDFPENENADLLTNYEDELEAGVLDAYLVKVHPEEVIDWKYLDDQPDELEFIKLEQKLAYQKTIYSPKKVVYKWTTWSFTNGTYGTAKREIFYSPPVDSKEDLKIKDMLTGKINVTSIPRIPARGLHIPLGLAIGKILTEMSIEHYQRTTWEKYCTNKACVTLLIAGLGGGVGGLGMGDGGFNINGMDPNRADNPQTQQDENGIVKTGNQDKIYMVEATGSALEFIHRQNKDLEEQMAAVVQSVAKNVRNQNEQGSKGRPQSGAGQQEERHEIETLLETYAKIVRDYVKNDIMALISYCRKENVRWDVKGLCTKLAKDDIDPMALIDRYSPQSDMFNRSMQIQLGLQLCPGMTDSDEKVFRDEVAKNPVPTMSNMTGDASMTPLQLPTNHPAVIENMKHSNKMEQISATNKSKNQK